MEEINEKKWCVYMHTNKINNKVYVGQTSQNPPEKRWGISGWGYKKNKYFWRAIQKYGWDNFEHIIFADQLTHEDANKMEKLLISFYETKNPDKGYNHTDGGEGNVGYHPTQETLEKMRKASSNPSEETRKKMSDAKKGKPSGRKGIKFSEEEKVKMREAHKDAQKCVIQLSKDGEYIAEYESIREASRSTNIPRKGISKCCNHNGLTAGNYQWTFKQEYLECGAAIYKNPILKPVIQIDKDGKFIAKYNSIIDAHRLTGINEYDIGACCREVIKSAGGFQWVFENNYNENTLKKYTNNNVKAVVQIDMFGSLINIYQSATEAAKNIGVAPNSITCCCKGRTKSIGGYMWRYYEEYTEEGIVEYKRYGRHQTVVQLSLDLQFINEFASIKDALVSVNGSGSYITDCCKGRKKTYKGYIWKYKKDWMKMQDEV